MPDATAIRRLALLSLALLVARLATAVVIGQPGYTDAYYYVGVASRLARGGGLSADFVWNPLELGALPVVSHRFWMPLATVLQSAGIGLFGAPLGDFRAAQLAIVLIAACVPPVAYLCARELGTSRDAALVVAAFAGLGGLFAPAWVSLDGYAAAAVLGALFFVALGRAAAGSARAGLAAGVLVGLLYLLRAEAALFGIALLALLRAPVSRRAGIAGAVAALAIGVGWLARDAAAGMPSDLFARSALLVRYDEFFALRPPTFAAYAAALPGALGAKVVALGANALTFVVAFAAILAIPLAAGVRMLWSRAEVRAWAWLVVLVWLAQSLVWTLHSTRGSYFHSLAAFFPYGLAIVAVGAQGLLARRPRGIGAAWTWGALVLVGAISVDAVAGWDSAYNAGARAREAALDAIPPGPFLAIDAAAWRWIAGRPVAVTPADGLAAAACVASRIDARAIVLEAAHFQTYDELYDGTGLPGWLDLPLERGAIRVFAIRGTPPCAEEGR